jgi:ketosteroid isomerase-like protein
LSNAEATGFDVEAFYQSYWRALGSGDDAGAVQHYHEDVVVRMPGDGAFAGEFRGRDVALAAIEAVHAEIYRYDVTLLERFTDAQGWALILDEHVPGDPEGVFPFRRLHVYLLRGERIGEVNVFAGHCPDPQRTSWWR